jgi:hypothetical protein
MAASPTARLSMLSTKLKAFVTPMIQNKVKLMFRPG